MTRDDKLIAQQIEYYRARAGEYDEWFLRTGRYDRGEEHRRQWFSEIEVIRQALADAKPSGDILELAAGTGLWTEYLVPHADKLVAVDVSPEAIEINRSRVGDGRVEYVIADLFQWKPDRQFDFIFFAFWLSHVPASRFDDFWAMLANALRPGGRVFVVDSSFTQDSTATDHPSIDHSGKATRLLNDGREYEIVKEFHDPMGLSKRLGKLGWQAELKATRGFFLYGPVSRKGD